VIIYLIQIAVKETSSYYGLPDFSYGGFTDAKVLDQQAAMEAGFSLFQTGLAGNNLVQDVGYMESGLTACWELIVMADEIIDEIKLILKGIEVNEETLALDIIDKIGPGIHFLEKEHTLKHFKETWYPKLINRDTYEN